MTQNTLPEQKPIAVTAKRCAPLLVAVVALGTWWIAHERSGAQATPPPPAPPVSTPAAPASAARSTPSTPSTPSATSATTGSTENPKIARITFTTHPPVHASVTWGNTPLGRITPQQPLLVERPRDSGPLDVRVRARGFLTVHTRAHTFADTKVQVKLTRPDQKSTLLGYRAPIDAGIELPPDDVMPPSLSDSPEWDMTKPPPTEPVTPLLGP